MKSDLHLKYCACYNTEILPRLTVEVNRLIDHNAHLCHFVATEIHFGPHIKATHMLMRGPQFKLKSNEIK